MRTFEEAAISFDELVFRIRNDEERSDPGEPVEQDLRATLCTLWSMKNKKKGGGKGEENPGIIVVARIIDDAVCRKY